MAALAGDNSLPEGDNSLPEGDRPAGVAGLSQKALSLVLIPPLDFYAGLSGERHDLCVVRPLATTINGRPSCGELANYQTL
jgi:hypothetical protein